MSGTLKVGGKTLATHDTNTNVAKIQLGSTSDVVLTDSAGNNVLSESGGTVTLTADTAVIEGSSSGDLVRITQTGSGNALVVEDSANPDSTPFVVNSNGFVGIGTSSPVRPFSVVSTGNTTSVFERTDGTYVLEMKGNGTTSAGALGMDTNDMVALVNGTERMRIDSSGSSMFFANNPIIARTSAGANSFTANAIFTGLHSATSTTNGTDCIFITSNGNIYNANSIYGQMSDEKLKENIIDATNKLPDVLNLRVRNFNFKQGQTHKQIGFIAQEFEQVFPHLVDTLPDVDADGNETGEFTKSIKTSVLMPILVKAIQEQQALIESQQSQIDALTARIEALETPAE